MILGVITARGGSKGLSGKNLRPLGGVPLIVHTIRAAQASTLLDDFVVSTDDPKIADVSRAQGARVPSLRPAELATDELSSWPAVLHAVEEWEQAGHGAVQVAVLLQPTSPLRVGSDIDACIRRFYELDADICATAVVPHDSPYFNMVEATPESDGFVRQCSAAMLDHMRRQEAAPVYALNGAVWVIRRSLLNALENHYRLERFAVLEMPRNRSLDIDTAEDLELADFWLSRQESLAEAQNAQR